MSTQKRQRILRNYHNQPPGPFHEKNQHISKGVAEHQNHPVLAAHSELISSYLSTTGKHDTLYHQSKYRSVLDIAERDVLQQQLVIYLDQIASLFEMAAIENPEILLTCGFDLAKERRSSTRKKPVASSQEAPAAGMPGNNT